MNFDHHILTLILAIPLVGAVLVALLPHRGKSTQWLTLAVTVFTFWRPCICPRTSPAPPQPAVSASLKTTPGLPLPPSAITSALMAWACG